MKNFGWTNIQIRFGGMFQSRAMLNFTITFSSLCATTEPPSKSGSSVQRCIAKTFIRYLLIDKPASGFLTWAPFTKAYVAVAKGTPPFSWDVECQPALEAIQSVISGSSYYGDLTSLWGQESSKNTAKPLLRADNVSFIKTIGLSPRCRHISIGLIIS